LAKCEAMASELLAQQPGLIEKDVALDIVGVGIATTPTLAVMEKWHRTIALLHKVRAEISWVRSLRFT
ncbi:hypothetical protein PHYSODRAFT_450206, partial [Phytophthora sojae]